MTLPDERYRAVMWASKFLQEVAYNKTKYPRLPKSVRQEAYSILRHFPSSWDMQRAAVGSPDVFQERMEAVTRLFQLYEQNRLAPPADDVPLTPDGS